MSVEAVEIGKNVIRVAVWVRDSQRIMGSLRVEVVLEHLTFRRNRPINPEVYGLAHRDRSTLRELIDQLKDAGGREDNFRRRKFAFIMAGRLQSAFVANVNSVEF